VTFSTGDPDLRMGALRNLGTNGTNRAGIRYPSPFFDIGHTYLPPNLKALLRWCRFYFYTSPIINAAVTKMAAYPITDFIYDTESAGLSKVWDNLLMRQLKIRSFLYGVGLDYFCYGNAFVGISFPFRKHMLCPKCGHSEHVKSVTYKFRDFKYEGKCGGCNSHVVFTPVDRYVRSLNDIHLMRWNPEDIDVEYNSHTGKKRILYTIPVQVKNDILLGKRHIIETIPDIYVQSVKNNKPMVLTKVFHFARQSISQDVRNMGWGISMILPVLKDNYYLQMLRKAQEMIAQEHIVPMRVLFPQAGSATSDPFSMVNLQNWVGNAKREVEEWRMDPNRIVFFPIPMGNQTLGGDGRALMLSQEMRLIEEQIIAGMGVPIEFIKGGVSFGGTALSMHILKNQFETYRSYVLELSQGIIEELARYMGWPTVKMRLKRFHMADDLQRASLSFQLNQAAKISDKSMLAELDYDVDEETEIIHRESAHQLKNMSDQQLQQAHMQGEAQKIQQRYMIAAQTEAQQPEAMQPELAPGQPPSMQSPIGQSPGLQPPQIDIEATARQLANQLASMPESAMYANLKALQPYPELHTRVMQQLNSMRGRPNSAGKPLPEQRAPRRGPAEAIT